MKKKKYEVPVEIEEKEQISEIKKSDPEEILDWLDTQVIDYVMDNIKKILYR
jgi:hypothetical protein